MKHGTTVIAFVEDPDGYKIEFIQRLVVSLEEKPNAEARRRRGRGGRNSESSVRGTPSADRRFRPSEPPAPLLAVRLPRRPLRPRASALGVTPSACALRRSV